VHPEQCVIALAIRPARLHHALHEAGERFLVLVVQHSFVRTRAEDDLFRVAEGSAFRGDACPRELEPMQAEGDFRG